MCYRGSNVLLLGQGYLRYGCSVNGRLFVQTAMTNYHWCWLLGI